VEPSIAHRIHFHLQTTTMALTTMTTQSMSSSSWYSAVEELIAFVGDEVLMLAFAAFVYLACTGNLPNRRAAPKTQHIPKHKDHCKAQDGLTMHAVSRALREGNAAKAVEQLTYHLEAKNFIIPVQVGAKVLVLLSQPQQFASLSAQAAKLTGRFNSTSLDSASVELQRKGDAHACKQLHKIADALQIPKSSLVFESIIRTHELNTVELQSLIEEIELTPISFSKSLVEAALGACAVLQNSELAQAVLAKAEHVNSDRDICGAFIKVLVCCEQWTQALKVFEHTMIPANLKPDPVVAEALTKAAEQAARTDLLAGLREIACGDLGKQAKAIRTLGKEGNLQDAIKLFEGLKQCNALVYNSLLDACVQSGDVPAALKYFNDAKENSIVDVVSYNIVIKGHLSTGNSRAAQLLLGEMRAAGLTAGLITYHSLLNAKVQAGDTREAWRLIDELKSGGLVPNAVTCSILLKAFVRPCHAHDLSRAMDLIEAMESPMDEVLFASVAEACIRTGRLDVLSRRMNKYSESDGLRGLTAPTYGSMIKAYGQAGDVEQVKVLWEEMAKRQVRPTSITLGCMVEALVVNNCSDEAWSLVRKIADDENDKDLLNTVIYSTILKGFAMAKRSDRLMALYEEMRAKNIPCNTITYNTMLNAFAKCGDMHKVPKLLEDMKTADPPVEPDIVTYSTMVKGFCAAGDVDRGMKLLHDMKEDGKLLPDEVMFNSLLDGCARQHRLDDALKLLDDMKEAGVSPSNYTLSIMVKLLGRGRRLNQAFAMVKSVCQEHGFRANVQVYTCLIQACFHNRQTAKAIALHDQVVEEGCTFDQKAYIVLARGCVMAGAVDRAADVVRCAHHVPGHGLRQCYGAPGVDARCLEEVLAKLNPESARRLRDDIAKAGGPSREQRPYSRKNEFRGSR
jgi:pentatricopeptide repeat protein